MLKRLVVLFTLSTAVGELGAADENSSRPASYKSAPDLMATLAKSAEKGSDQASAPISNEDHYRVNIVRRGSPGVAMAHTSGPAKGSEVPTSSMEQRLW